MSGRITIQRVAELADVSKATVSRVLNGYPHVRPEVREKVQRVIRETGYQPNNIARMLASDRSSIIGFVISSSAQMVFHDPYFPALTEAVSDAAGDRGLIMALFMSHADGQGHRTVNSILAAGLFDGLILTADAKGSSIFPQQLAPDMPIVFIGRPSQADGMHYVDVDNVQGGYLATSHLIDLGHRRIATIGSNRNASGEDRVTGYRRALSQRGLAFDERLVAFGDYSLESGYASMQALLPYKPEAVFVASDTMALGALRALREAGLRAPDDIALVSHDDLPPAVQADPPLTTVQQPIARTGQLAVEKLERIIAQGGAVRAEKTILPVKLVVRESCGAVQSI
ncbi:MAG: LacI family DNA-binding transcriptional regulator [Chloroflexi bacterium]|nr:LacI family DNA-binding transcriptional regulator [Chloroflexota bacterium]